MDFGIDFYTDVLDLDYLLDLLDDGPFTKKFKKLNAAIVGLIQDYSLVAFIPVDVKSEKSLLQLKSAIDKVTCFNAYNGDSGFLYLFSGQRLHLWKWRRKKHPGIAFLCSWS